MAACKLQSRVCARLFCAVFRSVLTEKLRRNFGVAALKENELQQNARLLGWERSRRNKSGLLPLGKAFGGHAVRCGLPAQ